MGPQVRFKLNSFREEADRVGKKVEVINSSDYGLMNGKKILDWALSLM